MGGKGNTGSSASAEGATKASIEQSWDIGTRMTPVGFYPKSGLLPGVVEVRDQTGAWDAVGQTRQLMLSDGGWVIEQLVQVDRPETFVYRLSDFQKIFGTLVSEARAEWRYTATAEGTHIRWTYTFFPRPRMGLPLAAIVRLLWAPYMTRVLPGIIAEIDRSAR